MIIFRISKYFIFLFILIWLEIDVMNLFEIWDATPDLILILVIVVSLREDRLFALIFAFICGIVQDAFLTHFWGVSALNKLTVVMIVSHFQRVDGDYPLWHYASLIFASSALNEIIYQLIYSIGSETSISAIVFKILFPCIFYTFLVGILVYFLFNGKIFKPSIKL